MENGFNESVSTCAVTPWVCLYIKFFLLGNIRLLHDKYESEAVILTTTLCSLHAACTNDKAR